MEELTREDKVAAEVTTGLLRRPDVAFRAMSDDYPDCELTEQDGRGPVLLTCGGTDLVGAGSGSLLFLFLTSTVLAQRSIVSC
ncbi:DUF6192 family protein [Streptomyces sp. NPDC001595]|uniref:DUF6192 family protein n=1 Tax=Streptomyces sp. NPDC001532 TaxID=3154520 RepID=UPI0033249B27